MKGVNIRIKNGIWMVAAICMISFSAIDSLSAQQQSNPGFTIGTVSGKYACGYNQSPGQLTELDPAGIPNTGLNYQWYSSHSPATGFTMVSGAQTNTYTVPNLTQTTYYYLKASLGSVPLAYSNKIKITVVSNDWEDINYLREYDLRTTQNAASWHAIDQLPADKKQVTTTYLDGLGRPLEHVGKAVATPQSGSTTWGDVVQYYEYDGFGRQSKQNLSYTTTETPGKYKNNTQTAQPQYYTDAYNESHPYSGITFDNSPLNRVKNIKEPGTVWAASAGKSAAYEVNAISDSVQIFSVSYTRGTAPLHDGAYPAGTLYKLTASDEYGKKVISYTDESGKTILKKIQFAASPSTGHAGWICVYTVYDDFGLVRYRLQPEAVAYLDAHSWSFGGTAGAQILAEQCFQYDYDDKGRVIWKKAPGQEPQQFIYDIRDRVVFTQDGNQAHPQAGQDPEWTATLYDELDRPTITALYKTSETPAQLQTDVDNAVTTGTVTVNNAGSPVNDLVIDQRDPSITTYKARNSITFAADAGGSFSSITGDEFVAEIDPDATSPVVTTTVAVYKNPIPAIKLNDPSVTTILKYQYYDDYAYTGAKTFASDFTNSSAYASGPDIVPIAASKRTLDMPTGSMTRIMGTNRFLTATNYYDEKGQLIQTLSDNVKEGTDVNTMQYHFDGRLLSVDTKHSTAHTGYHNFHVLTKYLFDQAGRINDIQKKTGSDGWKDLASYAFDDMGRLKAKTLSPDYAGGSAGEGLETLDYSYNIHNQITGVNKDYALKTSGVYNADNHFFGFYLGYDNRDGAFSASRVDGKVAGQMWNSQSNSVQRKYDYTYDNSGRISGANFAQKDGTSWGNGTVNFTVNSLAYDLNGNITHMNQYGLKGSSSPLIDNLTYTYQAHSNKLSKVTDAANDPTTTLGDFHYSGTKGSTDYAYDYNGNLKSDANKKISAITYDYMDQPEKLTITGKGSIQYVYDADGNKLQKIVTDNTATPHKTITTSYINGFVYQDDTLQYFSTEEGRVRPVNKSGQPLAFTYDYFVSDHLGDVRMVLTEQTDFTQYMATMEQQNASREDALFYNLDNTREARPPDYPQDNTTTPNAAVAKLNGNDPNKRIGPSIVLKVMAGDTIQAAVRAYYRQQVTSKNNAGLPAEQMLSGLVQAMIAPGITSAAEHSMRMASGGQAGRPGLTANDMQSLKQKDPNNIKEDKPKAYLNYVFFDNQLNFVEEGSGVKQVDGEAGELETLASGKIVVKKTGFVYVYTSNESQQDVLFDNMSVTQASGPILEETHYYPFGLVMDGISTEVPLKLANNYKYNGKELNHKEFSDGAGLDWYSYGYREYDPQIGRLIQQDPLADNFATVSPYQYGLNDPIANIDKDGLADLPVLTVAATAIQRSMPSVSAQFITVASKLPVLATLAAHGAEVAGNAINGAVATESVGGKVVSPKDPPGWLKQLFQFFGWNSQSNDPETRWKYAKRNAELNTLTHQMDRAQERLDKYSSYVPVVGGVVKTAEGMQYDKPMEVVGGMGSVGFDLFGGELLRGVTKGITVLGKFPDYINLAARLGARRFNIPIEIWNKMSPADQWAANIKFLDRAIARGDKFILANPVQDVTQVSGYFRRELDYLISKGYKLNDEGTQLIK